MKTNLLKAIALTMALNLFYNCSIEPIDNSKTLLEQAANESEPLGIQSTAMDCVGADPRAKVINNGTVPCNFSIMTTTGIFIDGVDNVQPGETTDWLSFPEGDILFVMHYISINGEKVVYNMVNCTQITLEVCPDNHLLDATPEQSPN